MEWFAYKLTLRRKIARQTVRKEKRTLLRFQKVRVVVYRALMDAKKELKKGKTKADFRYGPSWETQNTLILMAKERLAALGINVVEFNWQTVYVASLKLKKEGWEEALTLEVHIGSW